jgi:hypothetical protein
MIATNKWIIFLLKPFSTTGKCGTIFTSLNLKQTTTVEIPEGCSMHLRAHTIWPRSYIRQTELEIKHYKWIWNNNAMFPDYTDNAFKTTLDSLNTTTSVTIDYINKEVKIRKDSAQENNLKTMQLLSELKNTNDIHVHPNTTFYLFITSILVFIFIILAYYFKNNHPIAGKRIFLPTRTNKIEMETVKPDTLQPLYLSVNNINA